MSDTFTDLTNAVKALLPLTGYFAAADVTIGNHRILDTGNSKNYAILYPGGFTTRQDAGIGQNRRLGDWDIDIDLIHKFDGDTAIADYLTMRGAVIDLLEQYPRLGQTTVEICGDIELDGSGIDFIPDKLGNGPLWVFQTITLSIPTIADITFSE